MARGDGLTEDERQLLARLDQGFAHQRYLEPAVLVSVRAWQCTDRTYELVQRLSRGLDVVRLSRTERPSGLEPFVSISTRRSTAGECRLRRSPTEVCTIWERASTSVAPPRLWVGDFHSAGTWRLPPSRRWQEMSSSDRAVRSSKSRCPWERQSSGWPASGIRSCGVRESCYCETTPHYMYIVYLRLVRFQPLERKSWLSDEIQQIY